MHRRVLRAIVATSIVMIALSCASISYSVLHHFYGESHATTFSSTRTISIENYGQWVYIGAGSTPHLYSVSDVGYLPREDAWELNLVPAENVENRQQAEGEHTPPAVWGEPSSMFNLKLSDEIWDAAQETEGPVTISETTTSETETEPIDVAPISSIIGITAGVIVITAVWVGHRHPWGDAASTLFEHGLTNMTVRDVKIFGEILKLEEFTIPQLMKQTRSSKITIWRAVQKLIEEGIVQPTKKLIPSSNGLGGRGKPSRIYRYVSKEQA